MRIITAKAAMAFIAGRNFKQGNTQVQRFFGDFATEFLLCGNMIAYIPGSKKNYS